MYENLPFPEAIAYLRDKISLPTERWDDFSGAEHDAAFTVAGVKSSMLGDIRSGVERAIAEGRRPDEFRKDFERITGDWVSGWRANIVLETNFRQAYAAGRYTYQLDPEVLKLQPYLQWVHGDTRNPRPAHLALDGKVFRADKLPMYPPCGFGCACRTISLTAKQVEARGLSVSDLKRGDEINGVRIEPDKGFDFIPGQSKRQ